MLKQIDKTKTTKTWNNKTFWPKDNYIIRCIESSFAPNSNGNPMVTLEWEVVNQEPKQIGEDLVEFDGVKFRSYHVIKTVGDDETAEQNSVKAFNRYGELLQKCGIDVSEGYDDENPPMPKGKVVHATVYGKEQASFKSPTPEEKAKGQKVGSILKDPITGKDVVNYQPTIEQIYGVYDGEVKSPF
jgi:hypothetical protein